MVKNNALDLAVCSWLRNWLDKVCDINNCGCWNWLIFVEFFLLEICTHVLVKFGFFLLQMLFLLLTVLTKKFHWKNLRRTPTQRKVSMQSIIASKFICEWKIISNNIIATIKNIIWIRLVAFLLSILFKVSHCDEDIVLFVLAATYPIRKAHPRLTYRTSFFQLYNQYSKSEKR